METLTDCIFLNALLQRPAAAMVVSVINVNLGNEVVHAVIVAAAMEWLHLVFQKLVVLLGHTHYEITAAVACSILRFLNCAPLLTRCIFSINVHDLLLTLIRGVSVMLCGSLHPANKWILPQQNPHHGDPLDRICMILPGEVLGWLERAGVNM